MLWILIIILIVGEVYAGSNKTTNDKKKDAENSMINYIRDNDFSAISQFSYFTYELGYNVYTAEGNKKLGILNTITQQKNIFQFKEI